MAPHPADLGIIGFDHLDLRFKDRSKARHFFVEQLGLDIIGEGPDHTFLLFGTEVLGLRDAAKGERTQGVDHVALRVENWTGLKNRLRRARIEVVGEKEREDSRSLFLKGPEGLRVELVYRPEPHVHRPRHTEMAVARPADAEDE